MPPDGLQLFTLNLKRETIQQPREGRGEQSDLPSLHIQQKVQHSLHSSVSQKATMDRPTAQC
jgi:hypothetical protein